jgi:NAD-dependent dihydropyrimidine dehydrogenase PreA subunit
MLHGVASECPACGVPLQAYELVMAPVAAAASAPEGALHALVRADVCVGCGACVTACPEPGAIRLEGKLAWWSGRSARGTASAYARVR